MVVFIHRRKPAHFRSQIEVAGCFVEHKKRLLLLKRGPRQPCPGTWGIPAGKLEVGETIHSAMVRELEEETGWRIEENVLTYLGPYYVVKKDSQFTFHSFYLACPEAEEILLSDEHQEHRWAGIAEAFDMELIPGGRESLEIFLRFRR